jgi:hypothetical protein
MAEEGEILVAARGQLLMTQTILPINCEYIAEDGSCSHWTAPPVYRFGVLIRPGKCILNTEDLRVACCMRSPYPRPMPPDGPQNDIERGRLLPKNAWLSA